MIDKIGFEAFTFKKLSAAINSTEATIYRYFENKHRLLNYLITWYWGYLEYCLHLETYNIKESKEKLRIALRLISRRQQDDENFPGLSESMLQQIVIAESDKTYLTKNVDDDNKEGLFKGYKSLSNTIASYMLEINPDFKFARSLASTCLESAHQQVFFSLHLPSLSSIDKQNDMYEQSFDYLSTIVFKALAK
ncbi:MAG: TetR/AcrR family transcriptional regulator [Bacteroidota bacterium]